ncbi:tripartite tricarboxylate transporter substrate-binding protein [Roseomonas sp. BN140053]|uniref:tripartite tricarboxylate transporter substrate-binding protein n=1 Tax=Roseomonas sp. BN140053 TaxID=3391898 RepID=UPI0039E9DB8F
MQPFILDGTLKGLVVSGTSRAATLPQVPSLAESVFPEMAFYGWNGLFASAGTPPEMVARLHEATSRALTDAMLRDHLATLGSEAGSGSSADFAALVRADYERWGSVVRTAGIRVE